MSEWFLLWTKEWFYLTGYNGAGKSALFQIINIIKKIACNDINSNEAKNVFCKQDFCDLNIPIDIKIVMDWISITYICKLSISYINECESKVITEELIIDDRTVLHRNEHGSVSTEEKQFDIKTNELCYFLHPHLWVHLRFTVYSYAAYAHKFKSKLTTLNIWRIKHFARNFDRIMQKHEPILNIPQP